MHIRVLLIVIGVALIAAALLSALVWPFDALSGWLAAAVTATSVPAGALMLVMMMRLIPGAWGEVLRLSCEAAVLMTPVAALAFVPVLFGLSWLYPWMTRPAPSAFAAAWLSAPAVIVRALIWFAYLAGFGWAMLSRRSTGVAGAAGLVLLPVLTHFVSVDWMMSRKPDFASSAFGLQILSIMATIAFCAVLLLRHFMPVRVIRTGVLGALLLTLLLIWAYLNFMAYLIVWSGNLPAAVGWYELRSGAWATVLLVASILSGVPLLLLLFRRFRASPRLLTLLAASVLLGKLLELLWFAAPPAGAGGALLGAAAIAGVTCLYAGLLPIAIERRVRSRTA